jgi:hypothetical protein
LVPPLSLPATISTFPSPLRSPTAKDRKLLPVTGSLRPKLTEPAPTLVFRNTLTVPEL